MSGIISRMIRHTPGVRGMVTHSQGPAGTAVDFYDVFINGNRTSTVRLPAGEASLYRDAVAAQPGNRNRAVALRLSADNCTRCDPTTGFRCSAHTVREQAHPLS